MPATSAPTERTNSALQPVKTHLRITIVEDRSNSSVFLYMFPRGISLDHDQIIRPSGLGGIGGSSASSKFSVNVPFFPRDLYMYTFLKK